VICNGGCGIVSISRDCATCGAAEATGATNLAAHRCSNLLSRSRGILLITATPGSRSCPSATTSTLTTSKRFPYGIRIGRSCASADRPALTSPQIPDSPAAFLESWHRRSRVLISPGSENEVIGSQGTACSDSTHNTERSMDVRFGAHCGLRSDIARAPLSAGNGRWLARQSTIRYVN
jgi:hypothetical protein